MKNERIITFCFVISILLILLGTGFVLNMSQILEWLPTFLENHVFHRTFSHASYRESMVSLLLFPVFIAILVDALCFIKFSDLQKIVVTFFYLVSILVTLGITQYTCANNLTTQDLSSEMLFGLECFRARTFWPTGWYYSMEFRFLNTQLITAPIFLFTKNIALARAITSVLCEIVLFAATWFILHELAIKKTWLKLLCCTLIISPVSRVFFDVVQGGSYYIPHIAFSFLYVGFFISLIYGKHSQEKHKVFFGLFIVFAFLSGVSTIRYILNFTFPIFAVVAGSKFCALRKEKIPFATREFFVKDASVRLSMFGLLASGVGYVFNSIVLASIFTFKNMNKLRFNSLSEMSLDGIKNMLLATAGYNGNVSVFTPGGIANVLLLVVIVFTFIVAADFLRVRFDGGRKLFLQYAAFFFLFHLYTNICTEMVGRYFTMVYAFFIPFLAILIEQADVSAVKRWVLTASTAVMIMTNAYFCFGNVRANIDDSSALESVCVFLEENGYEFGYAFSNIANPIWFCSNGKIEVASIASDEVDGINIVPEKYDVNKWLTLKRFAEKDFYKGGKRVFFVMRVDEYQASSLYRYSTVIARPSVFRNEAYIVFDYESPAEFISLFY